MQSLAFPLRLQENGFLERTDPHAALVSLLQLMARTPRGSWAGSPAFGLRDLFEDKRLRADTARLALERINEALQDLQIHGYVVTEITREISPGRDTDTYALVLEAVDSSESLRTRVLYEP